MKTIKQLLITVVVLLCSATASAHDFEVDGIYYNIISANDFTVAVTYKGNSYDEISNEYSGEVIIPETIAYKSRILKVISIGEKAFYDCSGITSIEFPKSVTTIEKYAFSGCSGITSIIIPNCVTTIEDGAFDNCTSLKKLCIEDGIEILNLGDNDYYKQGLFYDCPLETLYLGRNLSYDEDSDDYPFYRKERLASVTIGNNVTNIGCKAFYGCSGITSIEIPNSVTSIGEYAFYYCYGLTSVTIGDGVTSIGEYAFYSCSGLTSITIPNSVTSIGEGAFHDCSGLTSIVIGNSVTSIGNEAFDNCWALKDLRIEDGEGTLSLGYNYYNFSGAGEGLFYTCPLETLYLGRNLSYNTGYSYGYSPFRNIHNKGGLTSVTIGNSVTSIGEYAFYYCSGLTSIHLLGKTPPSIVSNTFAEIQYATLTIYVPQGALDAYQAADVWKDFWDIREEGTTETPDEEVKKCATPVITYSNSGLDITSETDGAEIHTYITCSDANSYSGGRIDLSATYDITTYATKEGYLNSGTATATLCWIAVNGSPEENGIIEVEAMPVLITCNNGTINISGGKDGAEVVIYTTSGVAVGNATITNGNATISTELAMGEIAVVNIAGKGIKIVMQ